jgi:osmotically-inducible protein OsmY
MRYAAFIAVVALAVLSCSRRDNDLDRSGTTRTTGAPQTGDKSGAAATTLNDDDITARVRRSISNDSMLASSARNVTVQTNRGVVTLRGQVDDERDSAAVEQKARQTQGVERVDNELEVRAR